MQAHRQCTADHAAGGFDAAAASALTCCAAMVPPWVLPLMEPVRLSGASPVELAEGLRGGPSADLPAFACGDCGTLPRGSRWLRGPWLDPGDTM